MNPPSLRKCKLSIPTGLGLVVLILYQRRPAVQPPDLWIGKIIMALDDPASVRRRRSAANTQVLPCHVLVGGLLKTHVQSAYMARHDGIECKLSQPATPKIYFPRVVAHDNLQVDAHDGWGIRGMLKAATDAPGAQLLARSLAITLPLLKEAMIKRNLQELRSHIGVPTARQLQSLHFLQSQAPLPFVTGRQRVHRSERCIRV